MFVPFLLFLMVQVGVMVSKFASNVLDRGFEPKSGQINDCSLVFVASPLSLQH
jgi:hypothetical protein